MHGGQSCGPRTAEGLERIRTAKTTHGLRTAETLWVREMIRVLKAAAARLIEQV
jgi:hypothetical protein